MILHINNNIHINIILITKPQSNIFKFPLIQIRKGQSSYNLIWVQKIILSFLVALRVCQLFFIFIFFLIILWRQVWKI